ncbi:MAG: DUF502 domain-containing protein [Anaerohalosphaeraceae bacterium]
MAALLPTILTIWIFVQLYVFIQDSVSIYVNRALVWVLHSLNTAWEKDFLESFWVYGPGKISGFIITIVGVVILGAFLASMAGRTLWHFWERIFFKIPLIKQVYPYIKQVTDFFLVRRELAFNRVVALEYPRKGIWSIGLVTGQGLQGVTRNNPQSYLTVFVPSSPTPFTGYVVTVPREDVLELDLTIEEALRFVISGGVITPTEHQAFQQALRQEKEKQAVS